MKRLDGRGKVMPGVCVLQSDPAEWRCAVRERALDVETSVVNGWRQTLMLKAGSPEELHRLITQLMEEAGLGSMWCGEPLRRVFKAELEDVELLTGLPVFS